MLRAGVMQDGAVTRGGAGDPQAGCFHPAWPAPTDTEEASILGLDDDDYEAITAAIELLEEYGPALGRPAVDRMSS